MSDNTNDLQPTPEPAINAHSASRIIEAVESLGFHVVSVDLQSVYPDALVRLGADPGSVNVNPPRE